MTELCKSIRPHAARAARLANAHFNASADKRADAHYRAFREECAKLSAFACLVGVPAVVKLAETGSEKCPPFWL